MRYQDVTQTLVSAVDIERIVRRTNAFEPAPRASKKTKRLIAKLYRSRQVQHFAEPVKSVRLDIEAITLDLLGIPGVVKAISGVFRYTQRKPQAVLVGDDVFRKLIESRDAPKYFDFFNERKGPTTIALDRIALVVDGHRVNFQGINMVVIPWMQGWVVL